MAANLGLHFNPKRLNLGTLSGAKRTEIICYKVEAMEFEAKLDLDLTEKSSGRLIVLVVVKKGGSLELTTSQNHLEEQAISDLLCKSVVMEGKFSYRGKVFIAKKGNLAHAYQRNENLLLNEESRVLSEPSLEILANDVFCTHGATSSPLDSEQLYYLQTRGIKKERAAQMLSRGFLLSGLDPLLINQELSAAELEQLLKKVSNFLF